MALQELVKPGADQSRREKALLICFVKSELSSYAEQIHISIGRNNLGVAQSEGTRSLPNTMQAVHVSALELRQRKEAINKPASKKTVYTT